MHCINFKISKLSIEKIFNSFTFILFFLSPHIFYSVLPNEFVDIYIFSLSFLYLCFIFKYFSFFKDKKFSNSLLLSSAFIFFGIINLFVHGNLSFFNLLCPLLAFFGYSYILKKEIYPFIFNFFFGIMYIYFYFIYFNVIPDLFFRPGFDEDAVVFDNSSSNAIPMALNISLYGYIIINKLYNQNYSKSIFILSLFNLFLTIIQQSRVGLLIGIILFFISLFNFNKVYFKKIIFFFIFFLCFFVQMYLGDILDFLEIIGNINGVEALGDDIRGEAQRTFFEQMNLFRFFFGYDSNFVYAVGSDGPIEYTFNVFLDMWNKYGFLQVIIFFGFLLYRIIKHNLFFFQLYYLIPFFVYSIVESIFFPNFWDCLIYVIFFTPKNWTLISKNSNGGKVIVL
jgi:hypothetical protein